MKKITVPANLDNIAVVTNLINSELEATNCSEHDRIQIDVAIVEVFGNIVKYAYGQEEGTVTVRVDISNDPSAISITFIDHGIPYNPLNNKAPDTTLKAKERKIGGLGIFMTRKIMNDMRYEYLDGSNHLTILKVIRIKTGMKYQCHYALFIQELPGERLPISQQICVIS